MSGASAALGTLPVGPAPVAVIPAPDAPPWQVWLGSCLLLLAVAAVELAVIARRSGGDGTDADPGPAPAPPGNGAPPPESEPAAPGSMSGAVSSDGGADDPRPDSLLDRAREQASAENTERAIRLAYAAVHEDLSAEAPAESLTHWELYREYRDEVRDERATALRRLVELYERAVFGPDAASPSTATEAISAAETLLGGRSARSDGDSS